MTEARGSAGPNGPTHDQYAPGTPCWVSLMSHRIEATQSFYEGLFDWEFRPGPRQLGPYVRALLDGREVAGVGQLPDGLRLPVTWTPYLASRDVDQTAETVRLSGGTIGVGPLDAEKAGRLALGSDPAGAVFGIWQASAHLGADITGAPGLPGAPAWNELVTYESAGVVKFYEALFGYRQEAADEPDLDYVTLYVEDRPVAGIRGLGDALPHERGPHWMTYFEVADADRTLERVVDLGGTVLTPAHDSPHGRVATVADLEGARFSVVEDPS